MSRAITLEQVYLPNQWMPFSAAMGFHFFLLLWNPVILSQGTSIKPPPPIEIKMADHLPSLDIPKPKPIEKKVVKKAKKSGLAMQPKPAPVQITRRQPKPATKPAAEAPKRFVSKVEIPKFVPRSNDEPIAASPIPGLAPSAPRRMTQAFAKPQKLTGKTRGIRAGDINFKLTDRGSPGMSGAASRVVAIPIGEESGDIATLPSAPILHNAPKGLKANAGYRFTPGQGSGSGELVGKNKENYTGYHGAAYADTYVEGSLSAASGNGKGRSSVAGQGFEIGGPVGDRKIMKRRLPEYPSWAEEKGISAMVKIYFTVKSDGSIRSNMRVMRSSGYAELDSLAKDALMAWRFAPTSASSNEQEAWGVITFRFTLA